MNISNLMQEFFNNIKNSNIFNLDMKKKFLALIMLDNMNKNDIIKFFKTHINFNKHDKDNLFLDYYFMGFIYEKICSNNKKALLYYKKAHKIYKYPYIIKSISHFETDPYLAINLLTSAISITPDDPDAYYKRSLVYLKLGDEDNYEKDKSMAIHLNPKYAAEY